MAGASLDVLRPVQVELQEPEVSTHAVHTDVAQRRIWRGIWFVRRHLVSAVNKKERLVSFKRQTTCGGPKRRPTPR